MGGSEVRGPVKAGRSDPRTSTSRLRRNRGARGTLLGGARDGFMRAGPARQARSAMILVGLLVADPQIMAVRLQNDVGCERRYCQRIGDNHRCRSGQQRRYFKYF